MDENMYKSVLSDSQLAPGARFVICLVAANADPSGFCGMEWDDIFESGGVEPARWVDERKQALASPYLSEVDDGLRLHVPLERERRGA